MNNLLVKENKKIENMIYEIRGKQVMLDSDVAMLFRYETFNLNKAVNRNIQKFENDYMFRLTENEYKTLIFQNGISNNKHGGRRTLPYVFTEKGILMLATILKSKIAIDMSIKIIDVFVLMKKHISSNLYEKRLSNVEVKLIEHDTKLDLILDKIDNTVENHIFFEGQIYDAYSKIIDIFNEAKEEVIIIDNYLDKNMLDVISKCKRKVVLITADKLNNVDLIKYQKQYNNLKVVINKSFHDRFIILDKKVLYHLGSSLNTLGKKCFAITKMEEKELLDNLLEKIES